MSCSRRFLITTVAVSALAVGGLGVLALAISQQMSTHNAEVRGVAADYNQLAATPVIGERIGYFPRHAKNIEYWCRPYWNGINGSFDIGETEYLDWAHTMGWQPRELRPTELGPSIRVMHSDGTDEYVERPKDCYFYKYQTFEKPAQLSRDFQIVYDRTKQRAYFADSDGRTGPPSGD
jgi:hypothetical protein